MALLPRASFGIADPCGPSCISGRLGTVWNERIDGLTAYDNTYSNGHPERLRTDEAVGFYVDFSCSDLVDARVGVIPKYEKTADSKKADYDGVRLNSAAEEDNLGLIVSALVKPIDGVQVSASYAMNPGGVADDWCKGSSEPEHGWAMAANVNITDIIGIDDWSVGVEVTYVGIYNQTAEEEGLNDDIGAIIAATVYGGWQFIDAGIEYGIAINPDPSLTDRKESENISFLTISANIDLEIGDMEIPVSIWFGSSGLEEFSDGIYVGASASYVYKGVGFGLGLEYAGPYAKTNNMQYGVNTEKDGEKVGVFAIIPSVSLASRQNRELVISMQKVAVMRRNIIT